MNREYLSDAQIKQELTGIMELLDQYLCENNLKYTLFAGSLIGAKRHGGFVPWDDDIDIAMLRPDYERFLTLLREEPLIMGRLRAEGFELGNGEIPFTKVINPAIMVEERISEWSVKQDYLWVDVFPIDGVPEEGIDRYYRGLNRLIDLFLHKRVLVHGWEMERECKKSIPSVLFEMVLNRISIDTIAAKMIRKGSHYPVEGSSRLANTMWGAEYHKEVFPAELMNEMERIPFEGITVSAMKRAHEWLTIRYGDYMKLPPEEERVNHGMKAWRVGVEE